MEPKSHSVKWKNTAYKRYTAQSVFLLFMPHNTVFGISLTFIESRGYQSQIPSDNHADFVSGGDLWCNTVASCCSEAASNFMGYCSSFTFVQILTVEGFIVQHMHVNVVWQYWKQCSTTTTAGLLLCILQLYRRKGKGKHCWFSKVFKSKSLPANKWWASGAGSLSAHTALTRSCLKIIKDSL